MQLAAQLEAQLRFLEEGFSHPCSNAAAAKQLLTEADAVANQLLAVELSPDLQELPSAQKTSLIWWV